MESPLRSSLKRRNKKYPHSLELGTLDALLEENGDGILLVSKRICHVVSPQFNI